MKNYGFKKSVIDGTEHTLKLPESLDLPSFYSYEEILPKVIDQGEYPICVPCSISSFLNWRENLSHGEAIDNGVDLFEIYNQKTNQGDGMTYKEAFHYLRHHGVKSKIGVMKIGEYAMLRNPMELKFAILSNGPCFGALPVYNSSSVFWNKRTPSEKLLGYHAIALVGYTEEGFIIRNSWGTGFGENGYTLITYEDFGKLLEAWSVVG